jgi:hypothetical protein
MGEFLSINEVNSEFYMQFISYASPGLVPKTKIEAPFIPMTSFKGVAQQTLVRYFNMGGHFGFEDMMSYYPVISIQNFTPVPDRTRDLFAQRSYEGGYNFLEGTAMEIFFPAALNFKYQVSTCATTESERDTIQTWMYKTFELWKNDKALLLNKTATAEGDIGVVVPYRLRVFDVPRADGYFEQVFDFTLKTYVHFKCPVTQDFLTSINVTLRQVGYEGGIIDVSGADTEALLNFAIATSLAQN